MIKIFYQNVNSISREKGSKLRNATNERTYDFITLTETYLNPFVENDQIMSDSYTVIRTDRKIGVNNRKEKQGDILIAARKDIPCRRFVCDDSIEIVAVEATIETAKIFIVVSYIRNDSKDLKFDRKFCHENKLKDISIHTKK